MTGYMLYFILKCKFVLLTSKPPFQAPLVSKCLIPKMSFIKEKNKTKKNVVVEKGFGFEQYRQGLIFIQVGSEFP